MTFLNYLISGISLGSIYAIIALGYTMVYGIAKMLNFAHGDVIMVGAYICFYAVSRYSLPPLVGVILAMLVCTVLGIVVERLAYKPLRSAPSLAVLITAIGVSYFLQNAALLLWSSNPKVFPNAFVINTTDEAGNPVVQSSIDLFGGQLKVSFVTIATIAICIVIMLALLWFTSKTRLGKAMRACSEDKGAAQLMGINVNATISMTFAIGPGCHCRRAAVLRLSHPGSHHRFHARHQGLYRCRFRRHRFHPRCSAGRTAAGYHRNFRQGLHLHPAFRRHRVRCADRGAAGQTCGPAGQADPRESVRCGSWQTS